MSSINDVQSLGVGRFILKCDNLDKREGMINDESDVPEFFFMNKNYFKLFFKKFTVNYKERNYARPRDNNCIKNNKLFYNTFNLFYTKRAKRDVQSFMKNLMKNKTLMKNLVFYLKKTMKKK